MIIDSHHHLWDYDPIRHDWIGDSMKAIRRSFKAPDLRKEIEKHSIDGTILVQVDQTNEETDRLISWAAQSDFIKGVVGWIDLSAENNKDRLIALKERYSKLKGFRHIVQGELDDQFLLRPDIISGLKEIGSYGYTFDILIYPHQLKSAIEMVGKCDHQSFVLDHIAKPEIRNGKIEPWKRNIQLLAKHDHVMCKLSGIITEAHYHSWTYDELVPYMETVLEAFGPKRLMYGSDWPVCLVAGSYDQVLEIVERFISDLDKTDREDILGKNARRFYNLND